MRRIWRLQNRHGAGPMVVAEESRLVDIAVKTKTVRDPKNLKYEDVTDGFNQYSKESIEEVLRHAPEGVACVKWDENEYQWHVGPVADYPKMFKNPWKGTVRRHIRDVRNERPAKTR